MHFDYQIIRCRLYSLRARVFKLCFICIFCLYKQSYDCLYLTFKLYLLSLSSFMMWLWCHNRSCHVFIISVDPFSTQFYFDIDMSILLKLCIQTPLDIVILKSSIPFRNQVFARKIKQIKMDLYISYHIEHLLGPHYRGLIVNACPSVYICKHHNSRMDRHRDWMLVSNGRSWPVYVPSDIFDILIYCRSRKCEYWFWIFIWYLVNG